MSPRVTAVCVVAALLPEPSTPTGLTSIDKRSVAGRVPVGSLGVRGDSQQDTAHHGGQEYAVYLYADEDAAAWAAELGREVPPGLFGENLRTAGLDVSGLVIGATLEVGDSGLLLEVTSPRNPCATFARRMGEPHWVRRFAERRAPGAYARVLVPGEVAAGDRLDVVRRPDHGITVADLMKPARAGAPAALLAAADAGLVSLGPRMRADAVKELVRG
jgi:MOSC domain-containing protein YiiM